ncbi:MAG: Mur ligase family protein, partial [Acidobacteriota bacterium]|nr:Mur ligase family protein [Acidobacteriota bacterium]
GLGLPLAVLQMVSARRRPEDFDMAVLEMGMSSPTHEIQRLCKITPPDVGVELLVAPVHLEHLGTIENIAAAKAELIEGMKPEGTAVLNADDKFVIAMREKHSGPVITFGIENRSDVMATEIDTSRFGRSRFLLRTPLGESYVAHARPPQLDERASRRIGRDRLRDVACGDCRGFEKCHPSEDARRSDRLRRGLHGR